MNLRRATLNDCPLLGELNHQLIQDEGHRNRMTVSELSERMKVWLAGEYQAVMLEEGGEVLVANSPAVAFWRALGYTDYSLTLEMLPTPPTLP